MSFFCNICGTENSAIGNFHRELNPCRSCGANTRLRGMLYAVQKTFFDDSGKPFSLLDEKKYIVGIGMSDGDLLASCLSRVFSYTNTFYHVSPRLDLTSKESASQYGDLDFVVSGDILEHVEAPVSVALCNIRGMLKDGGVLFLTVPYLEGHETIEHYPHLYKYKLVEIDNEYILINKRREGNLDIHTNLAFHGGPGSVLEMRLFGEGDLFSMLESAGFLVTALTPDIPGIGYVWNSSVENERSHGRRLKSHVLICRAKKMA